MAGTLNVVAISGSYTDLSSKPTIGNNVTTDTGWTANSGAGDKTAIVPNYTSGITGTMVTALNVTSSGLGTVLGTIDSTLVSMAKKLQALETALAANKLPNT